MHNKVLSDPLVLSHARALLTSSREAACEYIDADVRDPAVILREAARTLDLGRPAAVLLLAILHFIDADDSQGIVATLTAGLAPGSFLAISHLTADFAPGAVASGVAAYNTLVPAGVTARSHAEVTALFGGCRWSRPLSSPSPSGGQAPVTGFPGPLTCTPGWLPPPGGPGDHRAPRLRPDHPHRTGQPPAMQQPRLLPGGPAGRGHRHLRHARRSGREPAQRERPVARIVGQSVPMCAACWDNSRQVAVKYRPRLSIRDTTCSPATPQPSQETT